MATFVKEIASTGGWTLKDGRKFRLSPKDIRHLNRRAADMVSAGLHIPIAWGHQPVKPMSPADALAARVKNVIGHIEGVGLTAEGRLKGMSEINNPEDAAKLPSIKHVSPEIQRDYKDSTGKVWPGLSITHVAVTAKPVNGGLKPFESVQMSEDGGEVYRLALDDVEGDEEIPEGETGEEDNEEEEAPGKPGKGMPVLIQALKDHGFTIPDGVNNLAKLIIAIQSNENDSVSNKGDAAYDSAGITEATPALMSLDDSTDARDRIILRQEREGHQRRAAALVPGGKVDAKVAGRLKADLKAERLFIGPSGVVGGKAVSRLEAYEALPGSPFVRLSQDGDGVTDQEMPAGREASEDEKEARELAKQTAEKMSPKKRA